MIVVVDTGPFIALAKLDRMDLLHLLGEPVVIPPYVERELLSQPASETQDIERVLADWVQVRAIPSLQATTQDAVAQLDAGERQAISLAVELDADTLLVMDDQAGRRVARQLDCAVTGVIGVLLRAKELGRVDAVAPLLTTLRGAGYWLSDEVIQRARILADETTEEAGPTGTDDA